MHYSQSHLGSVVSDLQQEEKEDKTLSEELINEILLLLTGDTK